MKDECNGTSIAECVCLRSKMYSILKGNEKNIKKAKGVKKCVVKKQIMHEQYKETLFGKKQLWHGMNILRSQKGHEIYGMYVNKISLSPFDSKRWIEEDGIHTKAYGYEPAFKFTDAEIAAIAAEEALKLLGWYLIEEASAKFRKVARVVTLCLEGQPKALRGQTSVLVRQINNR